MGFSATMPGNRRSLASPLAIAFGLVGIDFAHPFEQFVGIRFIHLRGARGVTTPASRGRGDRLRFLYSIWHMFTLCFNYLLSLHNLGKFELGQIFHAFGIANHFEAVPDQFWIEKVAQIKFDLLVRPVQEDVIPLRGLHRRSEFLDAPPAHRRSRG